MKIATCRTEDVGDGTPCPNNGIGFMWDDAAHRQAAQEAGAVPSDVIYCGPCGQPITDMVDAPADHPTPPGEFIPPDEPPAE